MSNSVYGKGASTHVVDPDGEHHGGFVLECFNEFNYWRIKKSDDYEIPECLSGSYVHLSDAQRSIDNYKKQVRSDGIVRSNNGEIVTDNNGDAVVVEQQVKSDE